MLAVACLSGILGHVSGIVRCHVGSMASYHTTRYCPIKFCFLMPILIWIVAHVGLGSLPYLFIHFVLSQRANAAASLVLFPPTTSLSLYLSLGIFIYHLF